MQVKEVMTATPVTVHVDTPIKTALALLDEHSITSLPVVSELHHVVGVVSEADLIRDGILPDLRHHLGYVPVETTTLPPHTVGEVMNPHAVTVSLEADLLDAIDLMTTTTVKSLPVVDSEQRVVGMVSRRDVVHVLARPDQVLAAEVDDLFRRLGLDWLVDVEDGVAIVTGPVTAGDLSMATSAAATIPGITGVRIA